jgi:signal transduction histidine kinase/CheY-like chemotaxis protein
VYEVIKLHGGTITATSEVGSRTDFVVTIPTGRAHLPDERVQLRHEPDSAGSSAGAFVDDARRWSEPPPPYESGNGASAGDDERTPRVLVVDDNADVRQYLARLLGGAYRVESAPDGESALRMVQSNPPDLIIADIMMPRMDGLALLRAIRQNPRSQALPFVLLSARAGEEARVEGIAAGADDYLVKPFSARELLARISGHLALQEGRERLLEAERIARADAEAALALAGRASGRAVWAQQVTALLAAAGTLQEIAAAVIQRKLPIGDAASGTLLVRSDDPDILTVVALIDYAHGLEHANQRLPASAEWPGAEAVRTGQSLWIESATAASSRFPEWSLRTGSQAVAALPLVAQERTIGSLTFEFKTEHVFAPEERTLLLTVASQCAAAVQRVRLHAAADRARGHAETGLRLRDGFLRSLVHDLKTPLASLFWNVQILSNNARAGAIERATFVSGLANIEASAREVMANIDEISDLVRAQAGEALALHVERVELVDLVSEVVGTHGDLADHTVRIVAAEPSVWVECDRTYMQRVMGNLLDNALKYSARGTEVVITLGRGERDAWTWAVARVEDHGVGIPPADLELVFDRYYRGANVVGSTVGQGIGLASARQLVEEHGGLLTLESTEGVGSTFTVWLPMTAVGPERDAAAWITV